MSQIVGGVGGVAVDVSLMAKLDERQLEVRLG